MLAPAGEHRRGADYVRQQVTRGEHFRRGNAYTRVPCCATVTAAGCPVATVVCVQAKDMKQPWCLAASVTNETARALINLYAKRWGIDIDQAWRLSRSKRWVGSICNVVCWVEHCSSVFSPVRIRAADRQAIAGQRGRAVPARHRDIRRACCRQDCRASCRAIADIGRGSPRAC